MVFQATKVQSPAGQADIVRYSVGDRGSLCGSMELTAIRPEHHLVSAQPVSIYALYGEANREICPERTGQA